MNQIEKIAPYVINKNLGSALTTQTEDLTSTNADGDPVVPFTQKQKYNFDRNGWLLIPGMLEGSELEEMQAYAERLHRDPESLAETERKVMNWKKCVNGV